MGVQAETTIYFVVWWVLFEYISFDNFPYFESTCTYFYLSLKKNGRCSRSGPLSREHDIYFLPCLQSHSLSLSWHLNRKTGEVMRMVDRGANSIYNLLK